MYAAAGGASLASRQARKRQQQQNNKQKLLQQKLAAARSGVVTPIRVQQSRQFHQLPSSYLRTPQAQARKLSASYTRQSQLLLPIVEGNQQQQQQQQHFHPAHHLHHHHHHHHQHPDHDGAVQFQQRPLTPKHGGTGTPIHHQHHPLPPSHHHHHHHHLTKSATASFPLVSQAQESTPPTTPISSSISKHPQSAGYSLDTPSVHISHPQSQIQLPCPQDSIIVTPATPIASPGHKPSIPLTGNEGILTTADGTTTIATGQLERKCSFYRVRRCDAFEHDDNYSVTGGGIGGGGGGGLTITTAQQLDPYTDENLLYSGLPNGGSGHKWAQTAYCEQGICTCCEQIEDRQMTLSLSINGVQQYLFLTENGFKCAQGRAAWLERGRRCSVQDNNPASCNRRWKRNRIHDSSLGGSSDDEDLLGVLRGPSSFANAFLYVGLGTIAIGLVIAFVGTGEKGFKTVELRLIGPSLIGIGLICCILRICFCICPSHCISSSRRTRKKNNNKIDADHTTSLLRGESKRVSIAKGPNLQKFPLTHKKSNNKMLNEGMEALRQIATTSLFLQNEQKPSTNRVVPIIKEPEKPPEEAPLEMKKLDMTLNITDISDDEDEDDDAASAPSNFSNNQIQQQQKQPQQHKQQTELSLDQSLQGKLLRQRTSTNQQKHQHQYNQKLDKDNNDETLLMETSLIVNTMTNSNLISSKLSSNSTSTPTASHPSTLPPPSTSKLSSLSVQDYDLPSSVPHQYSTSTISNRTTNSIMTTSTTTTTATATTTTTCTSATDTATTDLINNYKSQTSVEQKQHTPGQILEINEDHNQRKQQSEEIAQKTSTTSTPTTTTATATTLSLQLPSSFNFTSISTPSSSSSIDNKNKSQIDHQHHHHHHHHQRQPSISITTTSSLLANNSINTIPTITTTRQQSKSNTYSSSSTIITTTTLSQQSPLPLQTLTLPSSSTTTPTINSESELVLSPAKLGQ